MAIVSIMLPIRIFSVSKTPRGPLLELVETYKKYLKPFSKLEIIEVKSAEHLPTDRTTILLDERGKQMTSLVFAKWIGQFEDRGEPICFVIGGPFGMPAEVKAEARHTIALSEMTLPHDQAKIILMEQLYRAFTILRGKTYHY